MSGFYNINKKKGPRILADGVQVADDPSSINFTGGVSVTTVGKDVTVDVTGGGGGSSLAMEIPSGTVDGSNVTFTAAHVPFFINVNGAIYAVGQGQYASLSGTTITLAFPVGDGGFISSYYQA